jgi:hypothetical protein
MATLWIFKGMNGSIHWREKERTKRLFEINVTIISVHISSVRFDSSSKFILR